MSRLEDEIATRILDVYVAHPEMGWTGFNEGRALFYMSVFTAVARHRDSDVDFGILPFPLMTE